MKLKKIKKYFILLTVGGLIFISGYFYYHTFILPLEFYKQAITSPPVDVIIVPGVPFMGKKWSRVMKWRVCWSVLLYKQGIVKNIIYSGGAVYTPYTEANIMAMYARKMGIPQEHIFTETKAEHTTENLYYSYELAKNKGFQTIAFASDPFQSLLVRPYIHKFKLDVSLIPIVIPILSQLNIDDPEIESYKAYQLHFISIEQRETPEERLFYSKGGRIPVKNE